MFPRYALINGIGKRLFAYYGEGVSFPIIAFITAVFPFGNENLSLSQRLFKIKFHKKANVRGEAVRRSRTFALLCFALLRFTLLVV